MTSNLDLRLIESAFEEFKKSEINDSVLVLKKTNKIMTGLNNLINQSKLTEDYLSTYKLSKFAEELYSFAYGLTLEDEKDFIGSCISFWRTHSDYARMDCIRNNIKID